MTSRRASRLESGGSVLTEPMGDGRYTPQRIVVSVPCPQCAVPVLQRTYIPSLGSMNGTVLCEQCGFEGAYLETLAKAMTPVDPLPSDFLARPGPSLLYVEERSSRVQVALLVLRGILAFFAALFTRLPGWMPIERQILRLRRPAFLSRARRLASVVGRP